MWRRAIVIVVHTDMQEREILNVIREHVDERDMRGVDGARIMPMVDDGGFVDDVLRVSDVVAACNAPRDYRKESF